VTAPSTEQATGRTAGAEPAVRLTAVSKMYRTGKTGLLALDEVTGVTRDGDLMVVTGVGNAVHAVTSLLASRQIIAHQLRVDQASLDDAFVALTGRSFEPAASETEV